MSEEKNEEPLFAWVGSEYRELTDKEVHELMRRRKILKTNGKSQYVYIDNPEPSRRTQRLSQGTNFTPPKKKRK
jgi:hypothetical protein